MEETKTTPLTTETQPAGIPPALPDPETERQARQLRFRIIGIVVVVVVLVIAGMVFLFTRTPAQTTYLRDVFIIFMALEALIIGIALVILMVQLSILINLLQNEIKPIIYSTNETVNTLRGTATFLSNNLSEPVIKLNEYLAGLKKLFDILRPGK
ncbi:MAG: hypothetical protein LWX83_01955 [Anaerolineae bacterium]|nr:hypothetical protein [Anaerolineae bacterium]